MTGLLKKVPVPPIPSMPNVPRGTVARLSAVFRGATLGFTHTYSFLNNAKKPVRVLLEEDADGMMQAAVEEIDDGIPVVGALAARRKAEIQAAYERIKELAAARPIQEFMILPDQLKTVTMQSPVVRLTACICEWNGALRLFRYRQKHITSQMPMVVHDNHSSTDVVAIRADSLTEAVPAIEAMANGTRPHVGAGHGMPQPPAARPATPRQALERLDRLTALATPVEGTGQPRPTSAKGDPGAGTAHQAAAIPGEAPEASVVPTPRPPVAPPPLEGFVPAFGNVSVYSVSKRRWCAGQITGICTGTQMYPPGAVSVYYEVAPSQHTQRVILPQYLKDLLRQA